MFDTPWLKAFDAAIGALVHAWRGPVLTPFFYTCTLLGNTSTIVVLATAAVMVLAIRRRFAEALLVFAVVAGGEAVSVTIKQVVGRVRPPASDALIALPLDRSFPSGHSIASLLLYGVIAFLLVRHMRSRGARIAIGVSATSLIALVGLSRVYLGVHWPSDVVGSWIIGGAWLTLCTAVYSAWKRRQAAKQAVRTSAG